MGVTAAPPTSPLSLTLNAIILGWNGVWACGADTPHTFPLFVCHRQPSRIDDVNGDHGCARKGIGIQLLQSLAAQIRDVSCQAQNVFTADHDCIVGDEVPKSDVQRDRPAPASAPLPLCPRLPRAQHIYSLTARAMHLPSPIMLCAAICTFNTTRVQGASIPQLHVAR